MYSMDGWIELTGYAVPHVISWILVTQVLSSDWAEDLKKNSDDKNSSVVKDGRGLKQAIHTVWAFGFPCPIAWGIQNISPGSYEILKALCFDPLFSPVSHSTATLIDSNDARVVNIQHTLFTKAQACIGGHWQHFEFDFCSLWFQWKSFRNVLIAPQTM